MSRLLQLPVSTMFFNHRFNAGCRCVVAFALTKQGQRFLTSVATSSSVSHHALRRFVNSSSKHVVLDTLSHLLSPKSNSTHSNLSSIVFPLYLMIKECSWFNWNPKLEADVIALTFKLGNFDLSESLETEAVNKVGVENGRNLCDFYCCLIDSCAKLSLKDMVLDCCDKLKQLVCCETSSVSIKKRASESMVGALCEIGMPKEAEALLEGMRGSMKLKPSLFEFRSLVYAYGTIGLLEDMNRTVARMEKEGFLVDTVSCNMILASLGAHGDLVGMCSWVQRVKTSGVSVSIRTYNSALNSCPNIMYVLQDPKSVPLTLEDLMSSLPADEANLVQELVGSPILDQVMSWDSSNTLKLDLHGMHLSSAYVIFLLWIQELQRKFVVEKHMVPSEITVVCGSGKHSSVRGQSPVKTLIKEMVLKMRCPLKIDRKNVGCFICKGHVFSTWLQG